MRRVDVARVVLFSGNQLHSVLVVGQDILEAVFVSALWQLGHGAFSSWTLGDLLVLF